MLLKTLTGALLVKALEERPISFSGYAAAGSRVLLVFPHCDADFEAVMLSEDGSVLSAPIEASIALSRYFSVRGLPHASLSLVSLGEKYDIPLFAEIGRYNREYPIKCKQIYSKTIVFSAGMEHTLYTEGGKGRARIIEAPSETDFSEELLRRLCVMDGLPDTVRSIAYRKSAEGYRMASTDRTITLDSVAPLAGLLFHTGVRGRVSIICRGIAFRFYLPGRSLHTILISDADLFPSDSP